MTDTRVSKKEEDVKYQKNLYKLLSEKMPNEAIDRSDKKDTGKGYDTTGYGYQYVINRFNEVCGVGGWGYQYRILKEFEGQSRAGAKMYSVTVEVAIWVMVEEGTGKDGKDKTSKKECIGGHTSMNYADALKGAVTNGIKKTAAFFGVGKDAYEGSVDDDNRPVEDGKSMGNGQPNKPLPVKPAPALNEITEPQKKKIFAQLKDLGHTKEWLEERLGTHIKTLTKNKASEIIETMNDKLGVAKNEDEIKKGSDEIDVAKAFKD